MWSKQKKLSGVMWYSILCMFIFSFFFKYIYIYIYIYTSCKYKINAIIFILMDYSIITKDCRVKTVLLHTFWSVLSTIGNDWIFFRGVLDLWPHLICDLEELQVAKELLHIREPSAGLFVLWQFGVLKQPLGQILSTWRSKMPADVGKFKREHIWSDKNQL